MYLAEGLTDTLTPFLLDDLFLNLTPSQSLCDCMTELRAQKNLR